MPDTAGKQSCLMPMRQLCKHNGKLPKLTKHDHHTMQTSSHGANGDIQSRDSVPRQWNANDLKKAARVAELACRASPGRLSECIGSITHTHEMRKGIWKRRALFPNLWVRSKNTIHRMPGYRSSASMLRILPRRRRAVWTSVGVRMYYYGHYLQWKQPSKALSDGATKTISSSTSVDQTNPGNDIFRVAQIIRVVMRMERVRDGDFCQRLNGPSGDLDRLGRLEIGEVKVD
ncbi:hypothetical protein BKA63DRAFT_587553 [Paraphoma chrysanthemicola]|nr:hypothetical protein BKA63DRAFT_587553 [Paraphoma chrysanthemicola]